MVHADGTGKFEGNQALIVFKIYRKELIDEFNVVLYSIND